MPGPERRRAAPPEERGPSLSAELRSERYGRFAQPEGFAQP
jgi:hypothetical protein